ncbi:hypothetical protein [Thermocrispum municipale]|uniref:hypothetical protein n=1 Tax=Thermocrispum municipale TaxID=37926 RepID=UPI0004052384|nr:hypothetical protein [Thermocrispum municipale]
MTPKPKNPSGSTSTNKGGAGGKKQPAGGGTPTVQNVSQGVNLAKTAAVKGRPNKASTNPQKSGNQSGQSSGKNQQGQQTSSLPPGAKQGWVKRTADNGKGVVYQRPGATGNADMIRIMDPTPRYPHGYVRFYNSHGQPINLDGKPGSRADTHIPIDPNGNYPLPKGW